MPLIDAVALKTDVRRYVLEGTDEFGTISVEVAERSFLRLIDRQPTIEADHVRHGRCEYCKDGKSFIGAEVILGNDGKFHKINHCPNCGHKMDGGADNG